MTKDRKHYSKEFKKEAVEYWKSSGLSRKEVADKLGIVDLSSLTQWAREFKRKGEDAFPGNGSCLGKMQKLPV